MSLSNTLRRVLTINENADPSVRVDFETHFNKLVSESDDHYTHTLEGKRRYDLSYQE